MIADFIPLVFSGYWRDANVRSVPWFTGVYTVYACRNNLWNNTVSIRDLLYIGESINVGLRLGNHERKDEWRNYLGPGEELCYAVAPILFQNRLRAEAALIYRHKPPANAEFKSNFPYTATRLTVSGTNCFLNPDFTVGELTLAELYQRYAQTYGHLLNPLSPLPRLTVPNGYGSR